MVNVNNATDSWAWYDDLTQWVDYTSEYDFIISRPCEASALRNIASQARTLLNDTTQSVKFNDEQSLILQLDIEVRREFNSYVIFDDATVINQIQNRLASRRIDKTVERIEMVLRQIDAVMMRRELLGVT